MFKSFLSFAVLAVLVFSGQANAKVCDVTYKVKGGGIQAGVGFFELKGKGTITCFEKGTVTRIPILVKIGGSVIAARKAGEILFMQGIATGLGYVDSPLELLGRYSTLQAAGAAGIGMGYFSGLRASSGTLVGTFGVSLVEGVGRMSGYATVEFARDPSKAILTDAL